LGGGATAELFYHKGFDVTNEELRHGKRMLAVIAVVKAGGLFSLSRELKWNFLEGPYNTSAKAGFMRLKARWPSEQATRPVAYK
jgi:hypothetical protein